MFCEHPQLLVSPFIYVPIYNYEIASLCPGFVLIQLYLSSELQCLYQRLIVSLSDEYHQLCMH